MERLAFILSSGRTGTQFLAHYFDANFPGVRALHEPQPSYNLRIYSNLYTAGKVSTGRMLAVMRRSRRDIWASAPGLYVESNPFAYGFAEPLTQLNVQPSIIHIVRDPRTYVRSAINHGSASGFKRLVSVVTPYWIPDLSAYRRQYGPLTRVGRFASQWVHVNGAVSAVEPHYPHYHRFHFEDVFGEDYSGLKGICAALGLAYPSDDVRLSPDRKMNRSAPKHIGGWREWPAEQCRELHRICEPLMAQYGYGGEPEWEACLAGG